MADANALLRALGLMASRAEAAQASPTGQPLPAGPRGQNSYMGVPLPVGMSSLKASSQDSRGKRLRPGMEQARAYSAQHAQAVGDMMRNLFDVSGANNWGMPGQDWKADKMLDKSGFFDPGPRSFEERQDNFIDLWAKKFWPKDHPINVGRQKK